MAVCLARYASSSKLSNASCVSRASFSAAWRFFFRAPLSSSYLSTSSLCSARKRSMAISASRDWAFFSAFILAIRSFKRAISWADAWSSSLRSIRSSSALSLALRNALTSARSLSASSFVIGGTGGGLASSFLSSRTSVSSSLIFSFAVFLASSAVPRRAAVSLSF